MAPLTVSLLKDNWSLESTHNFEPQELSRVDDDLNSANSGKGLSVESHMEDLSVEKNLSDLVKKMLRYNESLHIENSQHRGKDWIPGIRYESKSSSAGSPQFLIQSGLADKSSPRPGHIGSSPASGNNDSYNISDSFLDFSHPRCRDQVSHYYDADTEDSGANVKTHGIQSPLPVFGRKKSAEAVEASKDSDLKKASNSSATNVSPGPLKSSALDSDLLCSEDSFELPLRDSELEHLKNKLMNCIFAQRGANKNQIPKCALIRDERNLGTPSTSSSPLQSAHVTSRQVKTLEKAQQVVIQAHHQHLNEMMALSSQEEMLLNHTSNSDFQEYVRKLDQILDLKCKHIENLRAQLQRFLDHKPAELSALPPLHESNPKKLEDCLCCA